MKKLFSLFTLTILAFSAVYADECEATYGVASVTFTRDGSQYKAGHFSVSETKSVKFSPANLAYTEANGFYFFENQYDYKRNSDGVYDFFAYGASGYDGKSPTESAYAIGDIANTYYDWGVYNDIKHIKGGQTTTYNAGTWRTLTFEEWNYLSNQRTNHAFLITGAKVNGVFGIILLPDDWVAPDNLPNMVPSFPFRDITSEGTVNKYTTEQWAIFENAGAVFLPAVGNSGGGFSPDDGVNTYCCYWSAVTHDNTNGKRADFGNEDRGLREVDADKSIRSSVRLVQDW